MDKNKILVEIQPKKLKLQKLMHVNLTLNNSIEVSNLH